MAAQIVVLYNAPTDPVAFERYYMGTHIPIAKQLPGLRSYVINRGPLAAPAGLPAYHLIAELTFDSMEALQAAMNSPEGHASAEDVGKFATGGASVLIFETQSV